MPVALNETSSGSVTTILAATLPMHAGAVYRVSIVGGVLMLSVDNHVWWNYRGAPVENMRA